MAGVTPLPYSPDDPAQSCPGAQVSARRAPNAGRVLFLILRILFSTSFAHLLRLSQAQTRRPFTAVAINYLVAALACAGWTVLTGGRLHAPALILGTIAGITYVSSMVLQLPAMRNSGVSVTGAVLQLSMMVPVGVAVWRFHELPSAHQSAGIAVTLLALPILSASSAVSLPGQKQGLSLPLFWLFLSAGTSQVMMKEFSVVSPPTDLPLYCAALFTASTLSTLLWIGLTGDTGRPRGDGELAAPRRWTSEGVLGVVLGSVNLLQLVCLLLALQALPALVVFPASAALGILSNAAASLVIWKERPRAAGWLGIALAVVAVLLLSWK